MKTTIFLKIKSSENNVEEDIDFGDFDNYMLSIKEYMHNYNADTPTWLTNEILMVHASVVGTSDIISKYHGNLDIINCASIHALKQITINN
jgi:hypothetical protein